MNLGDLVTQLRALMKRPNMTRDDAVRYINQGIRRVDREEPIPPMEKVVEFTLDSTTGNSIDIPSDYLSMTQCVGPNGKPLTKKSYAELLGVSEVGAEPEYFAKFVDTWVFRPAASGNVITIAYNANWPELVNDSDTNNLLTKWWDLALYAAAVYASTFYLDKRRGLFEESYQEILSGIEMQRVQEEEGSGTAREVQPVYQVY